MIYLVPIVFAATAAVLARPIATAPALTAGFLVALFLILNAEFRLDQYPYFEAPSLAIGALREPQLHLGRRSTSSVRS